MAQYIIAYHGGEHPKSQEEGKVQMEKWQSWLENLGAAAINPGTPLKGSIIINPDGTLSEPDDGSMDGFTVVEAESMDDAIEMARACPYLEIRGSLLVAEMLKKKIL